jgi:hypothetical protein
MHFLFGIIFICNSLFLALEAMPTIVDPPLQDFSLWTQNLIFHPRLQ